MADATGKAQGLAIDNLNFSASSQPSNLSVPITIQRSGTNIILSWPAVAGRTYQLEYKNDLNASTWAPLGAPVVGTGAPLVLTIDATTPVQRFFRLQALP
jgi:hypothetical protein